MTSPDRADQPALFAVPETVPPPARRTADRAEGHASGRAGTPAARPWTEAPRAAFDLETTGPDPTTARTVTATVVELDGRGAVTDTHEWLVNPGVPIPPGATAVHGITDERAATGLPRAEAVEQIIALLAGLVRSGAALVAFNGCYDLTVLDREARALGLMPLGGRATVRLVDPYVMDKAVDRYRRGKRTLGAMCATYGVELHDAHTSAADALACARLAEVLAARYPDRLAVPAEALHEAEIGWAREQAESFQAYLRRTRDPAAVIDGSWPVQPA